MKKNHFLAIVFAVLMLPLCLRAEVVDGLYSALIPVKDHSEAERNRGLRQGLLSVLVRLSGDSSIGQRPEVKALLPKAQAYTVSYSYKATPEGDTPQGLQVTYANSEIDRFLRVNQLPVWPARRPNLLVWLVAETPESGKHFVTPEVAPELFESLNDLFDERGLPVTYPLLDLEDQLSLSAEDAWTLDTDTIAAASLRYQVPAWLLVRAYQTSTASWQAAWVLSNNQNISFDDTLGDDLVSTLAPIGQRAVDLIAASYSYIPSLAEGQIPLTIAGIGSFADYSAMMNLFKGLSMVRDVNLEQISGDQVSMVLLIEGDQKPLFESLTLTSRFLMADNTPLEPASWAQAGAGQRLPLVWKSR